LLFSFLIAIFFEFCGDPLVRVSRDAAPLMQAQEAISAASQAV